MYIYISLLLLLAPNIVEDYNSDPRRISNEIDRFGISNRIFDERVAWDNPRQ